MAVETTSNLRVLKAVVILLGVAILAAVAAIVVTIIQRAGQVVVDSEPASTAPAAFGDQRVAIPAGAQVVGTTASDDRLVVRVRLGDGSEQLIVFDLNSGQRLGAFHLEPAVR